MIVIPGRIPISIHPLFWLLAAFIGWINSGSFVGVLVWIGIIFVSVLIHEFGHALTALAFKQSAKIQLIALGGLTSYEGPKLRFWQQFIIVFNGPLFGFFLFLLATWLLQFDWKGSPLIFATLKITQIANLFWSVVNLLPVMPLDGGQLLRIVLEASFGVKGFKAALFIGGLLSTLLALGCFLIQQFLVGAIFFLLAFQGFASWKSSRFATKRDREDDTRQLLMRAETAIREGKKEEARELFDQVRQKGEGGLLSSIAAQYLAFLYVEEGKNKEAYELLLPIKDQLTEETRPLLHRLAAEQKNDSVVAEFSAECYQMTQSQEVALMNARAFARLKQGKPAGGWLQTAWQHGGLDLQKVLNEEEFSSLKDNSDFQEFIDQMS